MFGRHLRRHAVAYIALFVALATSSYAAATSLVPKNSVGTRQVINHSLRKADVRAGQSPRGARGPEGDDGPPGAQGAQGAAGVGKVTTVDSAPAAMCAEGGGACQSAGPYAHCPDGSVVVGGGWVSDSIDLSINWATRLTPFGVNYSVIAVNHDTVPRTITAHAICIAGTPAAAASASARRTYERTLAQTKAGLLQERGTSRRTS